VRKVIPGDKCLFFTVKNSHIGIKDCSYFSADIGLGPLGFTSQWETNTGHVTCESLHCVHLGKNYQLNVTVNLV
jgi:hypothetical protein